jgi:hypothetical protein
MKKIKAFFDNGRSKREEERVESSDYAAAIAKLPKLETLAVNLNIIDSLPLTGSKVVLILLIDRKQCKMSSLKKITSEGTVRHVFICLSPLPS